MPAPKKYDAMGKEMPPDPMETTNTGNAPAAQPAPSLLDRVEGVFTPDAPATPAEATCPTCGGAVEVQRHTPDFATHHTLVCLSCGHREKVAD